MKAPAKDKSQLGQIFTGFFIALIAIMLMTVVVGSYLDTLRTDSKSRQYNDLALYVAKTGFEDGLSFFRRRASGEFLANQIASGQGWVVPWPQEWPDDAFNPSASDTDYWNNLSMSAFTASCSPCARAIVRSYQLNVTYAATTDLSSGNLLWGRYVIKRQATRNWSPGPNTFSAFTDPDAVHDITHLRTTTNDLGEGNYWGLTSQGYVFSSPTDVTVLAAHTGNDIINAPLSTYNNKPLLLARAKVYGELFRINFNIQNAALEVGTGSSVVGDNAKCQINGNADTNFQGIGVASSNGSSPTGTYSLQGNPTVSNDGVLPTVSLVFPGLDKAGLLKLANPANVGGTCIFPKSNDPDITTKQSTPTFYYLSCLTCTPYPTFTFVSGTTSGADITMSGVGLVFVDGNLSIQAKNASNFSGVIFVNGTLEMYGPATFFGTVIVANINGATHAVTMVNNTTGNTVQINYDSTSVANTKNFLQDFKVIKASVVTSYN